MIGTCPIELQRLSSEHAARRLLAVRDSLAGIVAVFHWCSLPYTQAANRRYVARCSRNWSLMREFCFAVVQRTESLFVGEVAIDDIDPASGSANLSYWITKSARGQGYAPTAAAAAARFAFCDLGLRELRLLVDRDNAASLRVINKLGARLAGSAGADAQRSAAPELRFVHDDRDCSGLQRLDPGHLVYRSIAQGVQS